MEWIIENWYIGVVGIALLVGLGFGAYKIIKTPSIEQLKKVKEWLLYATLVAEQQMGSGVGQIKLRFVYDMFITKFTWLAKLISFEAFSKLVDEALDEMKAMLESNKDARRLLETSTTDKK